MTKWSKKKRIQVTVMATTVILIIAFGSGTLIYLLAENLQLTKGGSIKKQVYDQAMNDPELAQAYLSALTQKSCTNLNWGYQVIYDKPLRLKAADGGGECDRFEVLGRMNQVNRVLISKRNEAKKEIVNQIVNSLEGVQTDSITNQQFETTSIWGKRDGMPYQVYILANSGGETFMVEYYPADPTGLPAVKALAQNFKLLPLSVEAD